MLTIKPWNLLAQETAETYPPDRTFALPPESGWSEEGCIDVTDETTIAALLRLLKEEHHPSAVALSFADPDFLIGTFHDSKSVEESSICQCSILYDLLLTQPDMYRAFHQHDPRSTDYMTIFHRVPIFRDSQASYRDEPVKASFISCAPPSNQSIHSSLDRIVKCAIYNGYPLLVLGGLGGTDLALLDVIVAAFKDILTSRNMRRCFLKIVFAVVPRGANETSRSLRRCG
jgi:uncharacterized protein (TIGR02452 family)